VRFHVVAFLERSPWKFIRKPPTADDFFYFRQAFKRTPTTRTALNVYRDNCATELALFEFHTVLSANLLPHEVLRSAVKDSRASLISDCVPQPAISKELRSLVFKFVLIIQILSTDISY
jgi:hypothetical protein